MGYDGADHAMAMALARAQQPDSETLRIKEHVNAMGVALWCDAGDHAFKGGTPGSQSFTGTEVNEEGREVNVQINVCPDHTFQSISPGGSSAKALPKREEK